MTKLMRIQCSSMFIYSMEIFQGFHVPHLRSVCQGKAAARFERAGATRTLRFAISSGV